MSSIAFSAAPFNENTNDDYNVINKKKQTHNKTQKVLPKDMFNMEKVNSVLEKIHNSSHEEEEDKDNLGDYNFNPPPKPESVGSARTIDPKESMVNMSTEPNNPMFRTLGRAPQPNYNENDNLDLNNYVSNYGDAKSAEEYYKKMISTFSPNQNQNQSHGQMNRPYYSNLNNHMHNDNPSQDVLMQKINYMINLLEEQQDEKTNNVTEEVILYSFLGIFVIFIVDSFAKVGKYVR
jgi:hypothetical protein